MFILLWLGLKKGNQLPLHTNQVQYVFLCPVAQSYLTLCNPMGHRLPDFSVHGIFQTRILESVAISYSKVLSCLSPKTSQKWWMFVVKLCFCPVTQSGKSLFPNNSLSSVSILFQIKISFIIYCLYYLLIPYYFLYQEVQ